MLLSASNADDIYENDSLYHVDMTLFRGEEEGAVTFSKIFDWEQNRILTCVIWPQFYPFFKYSLLIIMNWIIKVLKILQQIICGGGGGILTQLSCIQIIF